MFRVAMVAAVLVVASGQGAEAGQECDVARRTLYQHGWDIITQMQSDRAVVGIEVDRKAAEEVKTLGPLERRDFPARIAATKQTLQDRTYLLRPAAGTYPETKTDFIDQIRSVCAPGQSLIIPLADFNRRAVAELCDFSKSVLSLPGSVHPVVTSPTVICIMTSGS
jgi:hypothetical protein